MTLCTHVYIHEEIEPMLVFAKCRDLLGCEITHTAKFYFNEDGSWDASNDLGQGLPAWLIISFRPGAPLTTSAQAASHNEDCENDCDGKWHDQACWVDLSFDTTYSYGENGEGCGHLHARLLAELGAWIERTPSGSHRAGPFSGAQ